MLAVAAVAATRTRLRTHALIQVTSMPPRCAPVRACPVGYRRLVFPVIIFGLGFAISLSLPQHVKEQQEQHRKAPLAKDFDDNDVNLSLYEQFEYRENDTTFDSATPFRSFYDADNEVGYTFDVVPDIIHLVRWNQQELNFTDVVYYRSMYINHRPQQIMVHCSPCPFSGPYVHLLEGINFTFVPTKFPKSILGQPILIPHHSTDVVRLLALMKYGGVYLDHDVFVVRSLRPLLRYEAAMFCRDGLIGNMMLFFHKNSRFLRLFLQTYR
ncbi:uncharacterized protein LOC144175694 [Haemaphysalis longicornis]